MFKTDENTSTQQPAEAQVIKNATFKSVALNVFDFAKEHWKIEVIVAVVIAFAVAIFMAVPVVGVGGLKLINLNSSVKLESGQVAKLKSGNVSVTIVHFTNDVCPQGSQCIWSGQAVEYMLTVDGQKYATGSMNTKNTSGYMVDTVSSDYKTYAEIQLTKTKE